MRARLEFDLPDERYEFECASKGGDYRYILAEIDNLLRSELKYSKLSRTAATKLEEVRERLRELINDKGVEL